MRKGNSRLCVVLMPFLSAFPANGAFANEFARFARCRVGASDFTVFVGAAGPDGSIPVQAIETVAGEPYFLGGQLGPSDTPERFHLSFEGYIDVPALDSGSCMSSGEIPADFEINDEVTVMPVHGFVVLDSAIGDVATTPLCDLVKRGDAYMVDTHALCFSDGEAGGPAGCRDIRELEISVPVNPDQLPPGCS